MALMGSASRMVAARRMLCSTVSGLALGAFLLAGASAQAADRVVIALGPPSSESNLFWATVGDLGLDPSLQRLVGNDPITGEYDDSGLAREWSANDDFTEWTFRLHGDAEFHFGWGPVTAADVVHSYELHSGPDSTLNGVDLLRAAEVEAIDDHTVVFRFDSPRIGYVFAHAGRGLMYVYSKAQYDAEGLDGYMTRPAGSGPYRYVERRIGEGVLFERVEDHWQGVEPGFAELEMRWAAEDATRLALLLSGEADMSVLPRELQADALAHGHELVTSQLPSQQTTLMFNGLYMQTGDPAFNPDLPWVDVRIREAMNRAIDREEMLDVLYDGRAERLARYGMLAGHEGYVPELEERFEAEYGYDPERAKELLAEAGYPDAFADPVIPIICGARPANPEFETAPELFQVYFEAIGLETEIIEMDAAALTARGRGRQGYQVNCIRNAPIRPTGVYLMNAHTSGGSPAHGFEDDHIQSLIDELRATLDPEERERIAAEAFTYLFEQHSDMPIAEVHMEVAIDPDVVGGWTFPGVTSIGVGHWHLIEPAN